MSVYSDKFKDPRWQKKRLKILERDSWKCKNCGNSQNTLEVHHLYYQKNLGPWDYEDKALVTLCDICHEEWHRVKLLIDQESPYLIAELEWLLKCVKHGPSKFLQKQFEKNIKIAAPVFEWITEEAIKKDNELSSQIADCCLFLKESLVP